jgi:hypothetical protein
MQQSAEHNQEFSLCDELYLTKIDPIVFELSGFKQKIRQTKTLETAKMSRRVSNANRM